MDKLPKGPRDVAQLASHIVALASGQIEEAKREPDSRNPAAVALSELGAAKGGRARAKSLSPAKRSKIAKKAAEARWGKKRKK